MTVLLKIKPTRSVGVAYGSHGKAATTAIRGQLISHRRP